MRDLRETQLMIKRAVSDAKRSLTKAGKAMDQVEALEFLDDWLKGTTCHRQRREIFWQDGPFVVLKHWGHTEWCGTWVGQKWCPTYYALYDVRSKPDLMGMRYLWKHEGRWSQAAFEKVWTTKSFLDEAGALRDSVERLRA